MNFLEGTQPEGQEYDHLRHWGVSEVKRMNACEDGRSRKPTASDDQNEGHAVSDEHRAGRLESHVDNEKAGNSKGKQAVTYREETPALKAPAGKRNTPAARASPGSSRLTPSRMFLLSPTRLPSIALPLIHAQSSQASRRVLPPCSSRGEKKKKTAFEENKGAQVSEIAELKRVRQMLCDDWGHRPPRRSR